ncbi:MAG: hypothetical protein H6840_12205 [Planctomycetes bacterium]|nr:hypothetical protein [Planctomycetota bacterium]
MARKRRSRVADPDSDRPNPVVSWRHLDGIRAIISGNERGKTMVLFVGPRAASDRAARQFAKELGNPVHVIPRGRDERQQFERLVAKGQLKPMFPDAPGAGRPHLLMTGLAGYSESARIGLKHYAETENGKPFLCVASVETEDDLERYMLGVFLIARAEYKSGRPGKTI